MEDQKTRKPSEAERMAIESFIDDPLSALAGATLASAETHLDLDYSSDVAHSTHVLRFILDNPQRFVELSSELPPFIQDIVFQYYFLGRIQEQIASILGCNRVFVYQALELAKKAIVAKACHVAPAGIAQVWKEMRHLQRNREKDRCQLRVSEPKIVGEFKVKTSDVDFERLFSPETMEGSILKAIGC